VRKITHARSPGLGGGRAHTVVDEVRAARHPAYDVAQVIHPDAFGEIRRGALCDGREQRVLLLPVYHHNHRGARDLTLERADDRAAVSPRTRNVEQDDRRRAREGEVQGVRSVGRLADHQKLRGRFRDGRTDALAKQRRVVDNQKGDRVHRSVSSLTGSG